MTAGPVVALVAGNAGPGTAVIFGVADGAGRAAVGHHFCSVGGCFAPAGGVAAGSVVARIAGDSAPATLESEAMAGGAVGQVSIGDSGTVQRRCFPLEGMSAGPIVALETTDRRSAAGVIGTVAILAGN